MIRLFRIRGDSMEPTLSDGDIAVCWKTDRPDVGTVVCLDHPDFGTIVKRLGEAGSLHSDHPSGQSAAILGDVKRTRIRGRCILAITPRGLKRLRARPPCSHRA